MHNNSLNQLQLEAIIPCVATGQQFWKDVCVDWNLTKLGMLRPKHKLTSWKQSAWPCRALTGV